MNQNTAPTKANLMAAQATLNFSRKGYELLDKKRNVLLRELMGLIDKAKEMQGMVYDVFNEAYEALQVANITLGITNVSEVARSIPLKSDFKVLYHSVMGVEIPRIKYEKYNIEHHYSFYHTNAALDVAVQKFFEAKFILFKIAQLEDSIYKLADEIRRTQKRANALKNIQIPKYETLVKNISEVLEEKEREDFSRMKVLKKKLSHNV
jgi:V/A-type H+-transporting ATPase subunit D